jgi:hypothetical protein
MNAIALMFAQEKEREQFRRLEQTIAYAMRPFRPKNITITFSEFYQAPDAVLIEVGNVPSLTYEFGMYEIYSTSIFPEDYVILMGAKAGQFFAAFRIEPDDNVELGEN